MVLQLFTTDTVIEIHEGVINSVELQGLAKDKSLEGALGRIDHRIQYGVIRDVYDLAATYAVVIAQGHIFNDANKRTAYACMETCLSLHDIHIPFDTEEVGDLVIKVAQGHVDEDESATWLRRKKISDS
ncbi:MAG: type II toxin-antitoxin system death-on-curing family toxin [Candidatus Paceibacterota bacterium]